MRMSDADYQRQWRAKHGARTGQPGRAPVQPCGTVAAYKRHYRAGEETCPACRAAWAEFQRAAYQRRKTRQK